MRSMLCIALLAPVLVLAGNMQPTTVLPDENTPVNAAPVQKVTARVPGSTAGTLTLGDVDTIGGTWYDWGTNGPMYRFCANSANFGLHAGWMYSASESPWPDRNMRYNYYDYVAGGWNWIDPDFMASGVNVYSERTGFGNLDADPVTNVAVFVAHGGTPLRPIAARDMAPGAGIFEFCNGSPNAEAYQWPYFSIGANQAIHSHCMDNATQDQVWYTACNPWCTWAVPVQTAPPAPDPMFPTQNVAASKTSQKVFICWVNSEGTPYEEAYWRESTDGGANWTDPAELTPPMAYGTDTTTTFHITSLFPWYDPDDRLHVVASVAPIVRDTTWILPAEIWHYCPNNSPQWSEVARAGCDPNNLQASVGYNAIYATRPSIGGSEDGRLFVAWERFDSANVEPSTNLLRGDIWIAGSNDGGDSWGEPLQVTEPGTSGSFRFPCVADMAVEMGADVYVPIVYEIDQIAGFVVQAQGPSTSNPICVSWVPADTVILPGVAENPQGVPTRTELSATPNPFSGRATISYGVPRNGSVTLTLYDASGRPVQTLASGRRDAGRYAANLNASGLAAGVYFYTLTTEGSSVTKKLTLVR
ncbi:T9SS type A sorting domain-containing protein [candidate division WOR-3 bacterium]|nr:T9SS type A sorting domain-containing protein [candidate division WOR-3 bacterium]